MWKWNFKQSYLNHKKMWSNQHAKITNITLTNPLMCPLNNRQSSMTIGCLGGREDRAGKTIYRDWSIVQVQGRERDRHTPTPPKTQRSCPAVCCVVFSLIRHPSSAQIHPVIRPFISPCLVNHLLGEKVSWKFCQGYYLVHHSVKERTLWGSDSLPCCLKSRCFSEKTLSGRERGGWGGTELPIKMSWVKSL